VDVANNFVGKTNRKHSFGEYSTNDAPTKVSFLTKLTNCGIVNSVSIYLTWIFVCLMTYLLMSVFRRGRGGGLWLGQLARPPQLFQPCYGPDTRGISTVRFLVFNSQRAYMHVHVLWPVNWGLIFLWWRLATLIGWPGESARYMRKWLNICPHQNCVHNDDLGWDHW